MSSHEQDSIDRMNERPDEWTNPKQNGAGLPFTVDRLFAAMCLAGFHIKQSDKGIIYWRTNQRPVVADDLLMTCTGYDIGAVPGTVEKAMEMIGRAVNYHGDLLATPPASKEDKMFEIDDRDLLIEEPKFKVGDVVLLKSGGVAMTILAVTVDGTEADLAYFHGGAITRDTLPTATLRVSPLH